ncbi:GntR family transcriptional regulator [Lacrimispora sp.]|uniref:GntR family transcriptional regulator n=1 Tax=Lacrimispora sp. TaxID=2719234 RepID=UPI00289FE0D9|nr:GntR family transcriptional regulator [Lacrimispora sp.]
MNSKNLVGSDKVLEYLTDQIVYLQYKPGESLNEKRLAEELVVSRTPVREALLILKSKKFIDLLPQSGTYVTKIDLDYVKELVYMRHVLETEILLGLASTKPTIMPFVAKSLYLQEVAIKANDVVGYIINDDAFHEALFELANHTSIWEVIASTRLHHTRFRVLDLQQPSALNESFQEHNKVIELLEKNEQTELRKILQYHHDCQLREATMLQQKYPTYFI